jgi:hypothetical protein
MGCPSTNPGWRHDPFVSSDPLPIPGKGLDSLVRVLGARGSVQPITKGVMR